MFVHELQTALDGWLIDYRIRVEQQHIFRLGLANGLIVGTGETNVLLIGDEVYLWMLGLKGFYGLVGGIVITT